jgi:hypothetical protein
MWTKKKTVWYNRFLIWLNLNLKIFKTNTIIRVDNLSFIYMLIKIVYKKVRKCTKICVYIIKIPKICIINIKSLKIQKYTN